MRIKMTSILVDDSLKAFTFYTEVLQFKELVYMPEANLAIVTAQNEPNGTALLLEPNSLKTGEDYRKDLFQKGLPVMVMGIKDIQAEYERLSNLGVHFKQEPTNTDWGTIAVFDDTCGNYIQIHQDQ
jgi:predicted enzyme related to lactoylglutathione lyase